MIHFLSLQSFLDSLVYRNIQICVFRSARMILKAVAIHRRTLCLAPTYQVTHSFWFCKQKSQQVSLHCIFKSRQKKLSFNTKISLCSTSCISLCFPVLFAPPLIVFRCQNVCSTSHSSQSPHNPIKMTFGPYFLFLGLKVLLILEVCPLDSLESLTSPLRLRSHWTLGSESKFLGLQGG